MSRYVAVGLSMLAGAALIEVALVPGLVIGGAAVLAPAYLPMLGRRLRPLFNAARDANARDANDRNADGRGQAPRAEPQREQAPLPRVLGIKQAIAKTITFRIIVTSLDFTTNFVVIGELATAAGLSTFNLIAGPLFYLAHETVWNYFGPPGTAVDLLPQRQDPERPGIGGLTISRALAKTVTFRSFATVMDFTTNYVVVGDVATAAGLSAFGFFLGPFVYFGHEWLWDRYGLIEEQSVDPPPQKLLPAPA